MNTESQQCRQLLLLLLHLLLLHSWVSVPTVRWAMKPFRFLRGVRWQRNNYAETDWGDAAIDSSTGTLIGWVTWTKEDATGFSMLQTEAIMANIWTKIRGELTTSHVAYSDLGLMHRDHLNKKSLYHPTTNRFTLLIHTFIVWFCNHLSIN